jgi:NAD(P)-dependent dehydrogenase (short-subunit alcohol dehydrogenase family)
MADQRDVIVITGAGGGMGTSCIATFAGRGHLILADLTDERVSQAAEAANGTGASYTPILCDVTQPAAVADLVQAVTRAGDLRSLVHTAGISPKMATGRRVLEVDLLGTARVLDGLLPLVRQGTVGVCVGSIAGYSDLAQEVDSCLEDPLAPGCLEEVEKRLATSLDGETGYVLAKRGVMRLCERLAAAWGKRGGRLISVAPGLIDTEMGRLEMQDTELMTAMVDITPVKRPGTGPLPGRPADIANLAAFLCSEQASFISGCDVRIDGGLVGAGRHMGFGS